MAPALGMESPRIPQMTFRACENDHTKLCPALHRSLAVRPRLLRSEPGLGASPSRLTPDVAGACDPRHCEFDTTCYSFPSFQGVFRSVHPSCAPSPLDGPHCQREWSVRTRRSPLERSRKKTRVRTSVKRVPAQTDSSEALEPAPDAKRGAFAIVAVGASAGGLEAFTQLLRAVPATTGMAFVFLQHLDPKHHSILPELLARSTTMPVEEAKHGTKVSPDHIYVIPPNVNLAISGGTLQLTPRTDAQGRHLPIDFFMRSLAEERKSRAIGVVLSGTASDGTLGLQAIKAEGGITFAQDGKSAQYDAMPRSAIASGAVDSVLPPEEIAKELEPHRPSSLRQSRETAARYSDAAAGGDSSRQSFWSFAKRHGRGLFPVQAGHD